jgi:hypothetical protein
LLLGVVFGGGVEYAFTDNLTAKLEGLWITFGTAEACPRPGGGSSGCLSQNAGRSGPRKERIMAKPTTFEDLKAFILDRNRMRMTHVYKPVMLQAVLRRRGAATKEVIASEIMSRDGLQIEHYRRNIGAGNNGFAGTIGSSHHSSDRRCGYCGWHGSRSGGFSARGSDRPQ